MAVVCDAALRAQGSYYEEVPRLEAGLEEVRSTRALLMEGREPMEVLQPGRCRATRLMVSSLLAVSLVGAAASTWRWGRWAHQTQASLRGPFTEAQTIKLTSKACSDEASNCWDTICCRNSSSKCFVKNKWWAGCKTSCEVGQVDKQDPHKEPWSCELAEHAARVDAGATKPAAGKAAAGAAPSPPAGASASKPAPPKGRDSYPSLFCFEVVRSATPEMDLVRGQFEKKRSIFACESYQVFSDAAVWLSMGPPRIDTTFLCDLRTGNGIRTHFANTEIFSKAFDWLNKDGHMWHHDFIVKVDPDAVFFPERLKGHVTGVNPAIAPGALVYFNNCLFGNRLWMFGGIEVVSRSAIAAYFKGRDGVCKQSLDYYNMGEDTFLSRCLDRVGVEHRDDFSLLRDGYCSKAPGACTTGEVAFHPFKDRAAWDNCWNSAKR